MKVILFFLSLFNLTSICNAQLSNNSNFKTIDSLIISELSKFYDYDSIKSIKDTFDARIDLDREFKTKVFIKAKLVNYYHLQFNDSLSPCNIGVVELEFSDSNFLKKAYSMLYKRIGFANWKMDIMMTCVRNYNNKLILLYSYDVLVDKIGPFMHRICPSCSYKVQPFPRE